ncbi:hypothetical protein SMALA_8480 [Streptomyces malaysiensis subsp. malaysiensis]|nr:hypothetical protein SMALA_8480 [Streptomyces malaysiensis]
MPSSRQRRKRRRQARKGPRAGGSRVHACPVQGMWTMASRICRSLRGWPPVCDRAGSSPASVCQATLLIRGCHTGTPPVSDSSSSIRRRYSDSNSAPCVLLTQPGGGVLVVRGAGSPLNTVREPGQVVAAGPPHALPGHRPGRVPPCIEVRQAVSQVSWIIFVRSVRVLS